MTGDESAAATRKGVVIILDGLGDRPNSLLGGRTPLEAADTPNLNMLAGVGEIGLVQQVPPGRRPHTHLGVGLLFGMPPESAGRLARGPIEAAGLDWPLNREDLVIRANLATLEASGEGWTLVDRRAGRIGSGREFEPDLHDLDLGGGVRAAFRATEQHRGALRLAGPGLSDQITDTDPGNVPLPTGLPACEAVTGVPEARQTAELINRFTALSHELLRDHAVNRDRVKRGLLPATGVICRGAGFMSGPLDAGILKGLRIASVAGCSTVVGLSRLLGFEVVRDPRFSADRNTDLDAKVRAVLEALADHDLVYMHVKAPDILAHDHDPAGKRAYLERIDHAIAPLLEHELAMAVCGDHGTDSNTGWHIEDPVPSLLCVHRPGVRAAAPNFGETSSRGGPLGHLDASQFLQRMLACMGVKSV